MLGIRVTTAGGSTYLVGPSRRHNHVRVVRVSDHPVKGTLGPTTFADEFVTVELVSDGVALRMHFTHESGTRFHTSPIVSMSHEAVSEPATSATA